MPEVAARDVAAVLAEARHHVSEPFGRLSSGSFKPCDRAVRALQPVLNLVGR